MSRVDSVNRVQGTNTSEMAAADEFERECILRALNHTKGKRLKTAELLGISRRNLWLKLRKHGISDDELED